MVACGVFKKQYKIAPKIVAMFPASMLWPIQDMGTVCRQPHHPAAASPNGYRFVQCTNVHGNNCSLRGATPIGLSVRARVSALSK